MLVVNPTYLLLTRLRPRRPWLGEAMVVLYLAFGVAVSVNAQRIGGGVDVFIIAVLMNAFAFRIGVLTWTVAAPLSLAALLAGLELTQPDPMVRQAALLNTIPLTMMAWVVARAQLSSFTREVLQRRQLEAQRDEIEQQRDQLGRLNDQLDRQLRDNIVDRSRELRRTLRDLSDVAEQRDLPRGTVIRDRFEVDGFLGKGEMGVVYRCRDRLLERFVALKILAFAHERTGLHRFLQEVEAMAGIHHPAIGRCLHVDVSESGRLFQVQEMVSGETLHHLQARVGTLDPSHGVQVGAVLASALAAAHSRGVIHRDVKPGNVILTTTEPGLKLVDFGISKLRVASPEGTATLPGLVMGTPGFMAPEQLTGTATVAEPVDIYGLGATLYLLVTGHRPSSAPSFSTITPEPLATVIEACLEREPRQRPTAEQVRELLEGAASRLGSVGLARRNELLAVPPETTNVTLSRAGLDEVGVREANGDA
jgi:hypothetical protein